MRGVTLDTVDHLPTAVLALGTDYPDGTVLDWHAHRRAQLLHGATGVMVVETRTGTWTVPSDRAVLIPPGVRHRVQMLGVRTDSLYIEPTAVPWFPPACRVIDLTPLLAELLRAAAEMPLEYDATGRDGALIALLLHELADRPPLSLHLPLPRTRALRRLCTAYLRRPDIAVDNGAWATALHMSERTLSRRFRDETGMSPAAWRGAATLHASMPRLAAGTPVSSVAVDLGYASPAAFTAAFTRALGAPPRDYVRRH